MTTLAAIVLAQTGDEVSSVILWLPLLIPVLAIVGIVYLVRAVKRRRLLAAFAGGVRPVRDLDQADGTVVVEGTVVTDEPLVSPITRTACVFCTHVVEEEWATEWDETREVPSHTTASGMVVTRTVTKRHRKVDTKVLARDSRSTPFGVRDATGEILVIPKRARVTWENSFNDIVDRGSPVYHVPGVQELRNSTGQRRLEEGVVPVGAQVTVVGPVDTGSGEPQIRWGRRRRPSSGKPFIVSVQPASEIARTAKREMTTRFVVACGCLIAIIAITLVVNAAL